MLQASSVLTAAVSHEEVYKVRVRGVPTCCCHEQVCYLGLLTLSEVLVLQHVVRSIVVHPVHPQDLNHGVTEATHGLSRRPLHEHHHLVLLHHLTKVFLDARRRAQEPGRGRAHASVGLSRQIHRHPRP